MKLRKSSAGSQPDAASKLYYASDVHGSDQCWRKFLSAGRFYRVDALVMGGDLTGKAIVPIAERPDGTFIAQFLGEEHRCGGTQELDELVTAIRYNGFYPLIASEEKIAALRGDVAAREETFNQVILDETDRWMKIADERIERDGVPVYVMGGNDDPWEIDPILEGAARAVSTGEAISRVAEHDMISCSYANPTPWNSPRELPEDELYAVMKKLAEQLESPRSAIFNLHVPPHDSGLDTAMQLTADLTPVTKGGSPVEIPVGSTAVRQIIEEYQPMLALHGHIHESRGATRIGRTLCVNSGSEYNSGRIHGVIVKIAGDEAVQHQFVVG